MKARELLNRHPMRFLVWNLNEDTNVFWSDISTLEDNGFFDPWGQIVNIKSAKKVRNRDGDVIEYQISSEFEGHPVEMTVVNE
jgi:hypothetical protein